jgi:hypothetical protein
LPPESSLLSPAQSASPGVVGSEGDCDDMIQLPIAVVTATPIGPFRAARRHDAAVGVAWRLHLPATL